MLNDLTDRINLLFVWSGPDVLKADVEMSADANLGLNHNLAAGLFLQPPPPPHPPMLFPYPLHTYIYTHIYICIKSCKATQCSLKSFGNDTINWIWPQFFSTGLRGPTFEVLLPK